MIKDQDKNFEFLKAIYDLKLDEEQFLKEIDIFSRFMSYCNPNYYYNGTYLLRFFEKFLIFKKAVEKKYLVGALVIKELLNSIQNDTFSLNVDDSFEFNLYEISSKKINVSKLCNKHVEIKAKICVNAKEQLFCREYEERFGNNKDLCIYDTAEIIKDLVAWIKENQCETNE